MSRRRVLVVGGGFAGLQVVRGLARADVDVLLLDKRNHHLFQPLLYQVATAALAPSDIAEPLRVIVAGQANADVKLAEVTGVDLAARTVQTHSGESLAYDWLVLATGSRTSYFGHDGWAEHAPGLKTIGDALAIRRRVLAAFEKASWCEDPIERRRLLTFVVVGAGPTGVEMAGALREIALGSVPQDYHRLRLDEVRVVLLEGGPAVLPPFPPDLQVAAHRSLEKLGVEVRTGAQVSAIEAGVLKVGEERLEAETIVWAAGVRASGVGAMLGAPLDRGGRVIVEADTSVPGHPEVFVLGDLACWQHGGRERPLPGLAPVAVSMGKHAAACVRADLAGRARTPLRYLDKGSLATIGKRLAVADLPGFHLRGTLAWIVWLVVHLATIIGFRNRVVVMIKWGWAWAVADRSSRLLWQDEAERAPR